MNRFLHFSNMTEIRVVKGTERVISNGAPFKDDIALFTTVPFTHMSDQI